MTLERYLGPFRKLLRPVQTVPTVPVGGIELRAVSKRFRKRRASRSSYSTFKSELLTGQKPTASERRIEDGYLEALKEVTIEVAPGSALGVIGRNGSGKSTLLKLISGIYLPDKGSVQTNGRISALIELGAGFHPDFSGRENIFLGGVMYGLSKAEIEKRFDDIVRYAELEDFIDDPVRTYSSGMYMRLGFSLAIHTDPDILLIDEVLAVGDAGFIHRCHDTISEFKRLGKTLVFVTHDLHSVNRWCDEVIWLEYGDVKDRGEPRRVIDAYLQAVQEREEQELEEDNQTVDDSQRWGNRAVELSEVRMSAANGEESWLFHPEDQITVEVRYTIHAPVDDLVFGIGILRSDGLQVHGTNTDMEDITIPLPAADESSAYPVEGLYRYTISRLSLTEDSYYLDVAAHNSEGLPFDYHHRLYKFSVRSKLQSVGVFAPEHHWEVAPEYPVALQRSEKRRVGGER